VGLRCEKSKPVSGSTAELAEMTLRFAAAAEAYGTDRQAAEIVHPKSEGAFLTDFACKR
jgi:hypothetical protein